MAAPKAIASACAKLQGQINSCASSVSQAAGTAAAALPPMALDGDQVRVILKMYINVLVPSLLWRWIMIRSKTVKKRTNTNIGLHILLSSFRSIRSRSGAT